MDAGDLLFYCTFASHQLHVNCWPKGQQKCIFKICNATEIGHINKKHC